MFVQLETMTTLGKVNYLQITIQHQVLRQQSHVLSRACKCILFPCINKTLCNVVFDQSIIAISGIFWTVKTADINS